MSFIPFNSYDKNQVFLNSDRIVLNSKEDSVFILSNKTVGISANDSVHINIGLVNDKDTNKKLIVNSPTIELGLSSKGTLEPITKGESAEAVLNDLTDAIAGFCNTIIPAKGIGVGVVDLTTIAVAAQNLLLKVQKIKSDKIPKIKSKTSYTI